MLGNTRESVASDKAGIIKENRPVVIGPYADVYPIIEEAKLKKSELYKVDNIKGMDFN